MQAETFDEFVKRQTAQEKRGSRANGGLEEKTSKLA